METRRDLMMALAEEKIHDFSYSAVIRYLRKNSPERLSDFLKAFKIAFDLGKAEDLEDVEQLALMQAIKAIGLEIGS